MTLEDLENFDDDDEFIDTSDIKKIRKNYEEVLDEKENTPLVVRPEEIYSVYGQFCNFATIQMLSMISKQITDTNEESNKFLEGMIDTFVTQLKTSLYRGFELHELKQQNTKLFEIIGQDLMNRENKNTREKLSLIVETFEKHVRHSLMLDDKDDDNIEGDDFDNTGEFL